MPGLWAATQDAALLPRARAPACPGGALSQWECLGCCCPRCVWWAGHRGGAPSSSSGLVLGYLLRAESCCMLGRSLAPGFCFHSSRSRLQTRVVRQELPCMSCLTTVLASPCPPSPCCRRHPPGSLLALSTPPWSRGKHLPLFFSSFFRNCFGKRSVCLPDPALGGATQRCQLGGQTGTSSWCWLGLSASLGRTSHQASSFFWRCWGLNPGLSC